ncbi:ABC transporter ATP-binding protein [Faecalicatena fissicatena]|uniref:ABC transporter ATP-binding protein n=1 Tax=Faecalicatena fissicatena TaxID=290055 RepID=A0ABS2EBC7_9FIRM|nr:ABC transporter ATP-binding protein [Faecalicatena fissicatena]HIX98156.1 ABC transporter ATP-binding protein/permease [Candidatus Dorea intestinigallinarum]
MRPYIKQNKILFALTLFTSVIASLGYVFMAVLLQQLLDIAVERDIRQFLQIVVFSIAYFALLGMFLYLQSLLSKKVVCRIIYQIRSDMFRGTMARNMEDFYRKNTADYISVMTNDVKMLEENFLLPLFEVVQYTVIFISSFVLMICFDLIVTIFVTMAIAVMFLVPGLLGRSLEIRQNSFSSKLAAFTVSLKDILSGFEVIKSYSMKEYAAQRFDRENKETARSKYSVDRLLALNEGVSAFLSLMVQIVVFFLSAYFIITGRITVGTLLGMVQVSSNLANPLVMIFTNIPKMKSMQPIIEKLKETANFPAALSRKGVPASCQNCIYANELSFSYDGQKEVLSGVNCTIERGKKYVLVGKSGCGKSTLIKLLSGCYSTYRGEILYDNTELHRTDPDTVAQLSSTIHQNIYMFDESIYDNICLHEDYPGEMIKKATDESGLTEFLSGLPEGLQYQVGENGSNLSGGQKQRIAVARALIRSKPILILDEGTSAIDRQTAYDIENRLLKLQDLTLITVTHHLDEDLLKKYDKILYMENGCIKEEGAFESLISVPSRFAAYFQLKK